MIQLIFLGADAPALVARAQAAGFLPSVPPTRASRAGATFSMRGAVAEEVGHSEELVLSWGQEGHLDYSRERDFLLLASGAWSPSAHGLLELLCDWPFLTCTTNGLFPEEWGDYRSAHGWAFALRGAGHKLVSPRVLERGPWRRLRAEASDTTVIQFHQLETDGETALEQARPGHVLLEFMWRGGHYAGHAGAFRGHASRYKPSLYDPATHTSIVIVEGREVSAQEMGIAAATRIHQVFPEPVEQVAFVYLDEATARRQLPALWLYGLEVRAMTAQGERRIDLDYSPPPVELPAWVRAL